MPRRKSNNYGVELLNKTPPKHPRITLSYVGYYPKTPRRNDFLTPLYMQTDYFYKYQKYKSKYLNLNNITPNLTQEGGLKPNTKDAGAGVVLLENYTNPKTRESGLAVILFRNKFNKMYTDGGGVRDKEEDIKDTARRELREESANLFRLSKDSLSNRLAVRVHKYVGYFVKLKSPIMSKKYFSNLDKIKRNKSPRYWRETDDFKRVFIRDFIDAGGLKKGELKRVRTTDNKTISIHGRAKALLRKGLEEDIIRDVGSIKPRINARFNSVGGNTFLDGTFNYYT